MKKVLFLIALFFAFLGNCKAQKINVYFFTGKGCEYCNDGLKYLYDHMEKYENYVDIKVYEVWNNQKNNAFYNDIKKHNINAFTIPFVLIGDSFALNGYKDGQGAAILSKAYDYSFDSNYKDLGAKILQNHPDVTELSVKETLINEGIIHEKGSAKEYLIIASIFIILIIIGIFIIKKAKLI